jgi:hypothetical protein
MKNFGHLVAGLVIVYAGVFLLDLWYDIMDGNTLFKVTVTFGVLIVVLTVVFLVKRELIEEEKMRKERHID